MKTLGFSDFKYLQLQKVPKKIHLLIEKSTRPLLTLANYQGNFVFVVVLIINHTHKSGKHDSVQKSSEVCGWNECDKVRRGEGIEGLIVELERCVKNVNGEKNGLK